jgi:hypothetical protein
LHGSLAYHIRYLKAETTLAINLISKALKVIVTSLYTRDININRNTLIRELYFISIEPLKYINKEVYKI